MDTADSTAIFTEGTFEEQVQELVTYLYRSRPDADRVEVVRSFQESLRTPEGQTPLQKDDVRKRVVITQLVAEVKDLGDGSDREIEGFFNLLFSHLCSLYKSDSLELSQHVTTLVKLIGSSNSDHTSLKYRLLTNFFNNIPRRSGLRQVVCEELVRLATYNDELDVLQLSPADIDRWAHEWGLSQEQKSELLRIIADSYTKAGQSESAYKYVLAYAESIPSGSQSSEAAGLEVIAAALKLPFVFDFDPLFKIDAVERLQGQPLYSLLKIFASKGLSEYKAWEQENGSVLEAHTFDNNQLEHKLRLLALTSLCCNYIGHELTYAEMASTLQIEPSQVEKWIIDAIRSGLVWGKLSQTTQTLHVTKATSRGFKQDHWKMLEKRLATWKSGLSGVLDVVISAQQPGPLSTAVNGHIDKTARVPITVA